MIHTIFLSLFQAIQVFKDYLERLKALASFGSSPGPGGLQVDITTFWAVKEQLITTGNHVINYFIATLFN
jgi:hypothetical protein